VSEFLFLNYTRRNNNPSSTPHHPVVTSNEFTVAPRLHVVPAASANNAPVSCNLMDSPLAKRTKAPSRRTATRVLGRPDVNNMCAGSSGGWAAPHRLNVLSDEHAPLRARWDSDTDLPQLRLLRFTPANADLTRGYIGLR